MGHALLDLLPHYDFDSLEIIQPVLNNKASSELRLLYEAVGKSFIGHFRIDTANLPLGGIQSLKQSKIQSFEIDYGGKRDTFLIPLIVESLPETLREIKVIYYHDHKVDAFYPGKN